MLSIITGKTPKQEASKKWRTFDLVAWIRARRLQWAGYILRLTDTKRKVKQAVFEMFKNPQEGDLLMDAPKASTWRALMKLAEDKNGWRDEVRRLRQEKLRNTSKSKSTTRLKFKAPDKKEKQASTAMAKYRARDARAAMFYPKLQNPKPKKAAKKAKAKAKTRSLTNAERAKWAREHYHENHGITKAPSATPAESPIKFSVSTPEILGHHKNPSNSNNNPPLRLTPTVRWG